MTTPIDPMAAVKVLREAAANLLQPIDAEYNNFGGSITSAADALHDALAATAHVAQTSEPVAWRGLNDVQWMNIVNHGQAFYLYDKNDAVHEAVKMTEAKLKEINATPQALPAIEQAKAPKTAAPCSCGLHQIPAWADAVSWYWQKHARAECSLQLPNERCWCGLLRSEHIEGHADPAVSQAKPDLSGLTRYAENTYPDQCESADGMLAESWGEYVRLTDVEALLAAQHQAAGGGPDDQEKLDAARYRRLRTKKDFSDMPTSEIRGKAWVVCLDPKQQIPTSIPCFGVDLDFAVDSDILAGGAHE